MIANITKSVVDAATPGAVIWDRKLPGFGLRVGKSPKTVGATAPRTFLIRYRANGKQRWFKIGRYGRLTVDEARDFARKRLAEVELGGDPAAAKAAERQKRRQGIPHEQTVAGALEKYLKWPEHSARKSARQIEQTLRRDMLPYIGHKALDAVKVEDIKRVRDAKVEAGRHIASNRALTQTRHFFGWLAREGYIAADPAAGVQKALKSEAPRDRYLSDPEIAIFWAGCDKMVAPYGQFLRFALLTGQRRGELAGMKWTDLDREARLWRLAGENTKTGVGTDVPLSTEAWSIIEALPRAGEFVFATPSGAQLQNWGRATAQINAACGFAKPFTIHDLRRTLRTGLAALRVSSDIAELILNHSAGDRIRQTYDHHRYGDEKREALDRWGAHVAGLCGRLEENVIPIAGPMARRALG